MIDQVMASWNTANFRIFLEDQMGEYHARMSFALMEQTAILASDSIVDYSDSIMLKWESIHTLSGDYAKAMYQVQNGDLNAAETTTENMDLGA